MNGNHIIALLRREPIDTTSSEAGPVGWIRAVRRMFLPSTRYVIDFGCTDRWRQFDTDQDAEYFGVWFCFETRESLTYAEGDWTLVSCATADGFRAELDSANAFYQGEQPAAFTAIDTESGQVTKYYDARPCAGDVR